jgi:hypothetical protein
MPVVPYLCVEPICCCYGEFEPFNVIAHLVSFDSPFVYYFLIFLMISAMLFKVESDLVTKQRKPYVLSLTMDNKPYLSVLRTIR